MTSTCSTTLSAVETSAAASWPSGAPECCQISGTPATAQKSWNLSEARICYLCHASEGGRYKILPLTAALLLVASPVAAQTSQIQQPLGAGGICLEEMVATLQCTHQPEPQWLWFERLCWIKYGIGPECWVWADRPHWRRLAVTGYSELSGISVAQRVVQLTKGAECGANCRPRSGDRLMVGSPLAHAAITIASGPLADQSLAPTSAVVPRYRNPPTLRKRQAMRLRLIRASRSIDSYLREVSAAPPIGINGVNSRQAARPSLSPLQTGLPVRCPDRSVQGFGL